MKGNVPSVPWFPENSSYFRKEADFLLRQDVHEVQPAWGAWLGQYQTKLQRELRNPHRRKRENSTCVEHSR